MNLYKEGRAQEPAEDANPRRRTTSSARIIILFTKTKTFECRVHQI